MQPSVQLRYSKCCLVSSYTVIEFSSGYAQVGLILCWLHIPHCWKFYVVAHLLVIPIDYEGSVFGTCFAIFSLLSSFAIILMKKREFYITLLLYFNCFPDVL